MPCRSCYQLLAAADVEARRRLVEQDDARARSSVCAQEAHVDVPPRTRSGTGDRRTRRPGSAPTVRARVRGRRPCRCATTARARRTWPSSRLRSRSSRGSSAAASAGEEKAMRSRSVRTSQRPSRCTQHLDRARGSDAGRAPRRGAAWSSRHRSRPRIDPTFAARAPSSRCPASTVVPSSSSEMSVNWSAGPTGSAA